MLPGSPCESGHQYGQWSAAKPRYSSLLSLERESIPCAPIPNMVLFIGDSEPRAVKHLLQPRVLSYPTWFSLF